MGLAGKYIVIDGVDGSGKSTQIQRLQAWLDEQRQPWVYAKDPGGTTIGDRIRHVLLGFDLSQMAPRCEALLFMASRAQLVEEVVRPALAGGKTVVGDRFISATCAYQVAAGFPRDQVIQLGRLAVGDLWPDLTLILDVSPETCFERTGRKPHHVARKDGAGQTSLFDGATVDAMERRPLEFHRVVRENFRELPAYYPRPVRLIDASRGLEAVFAEIKETLIAAFP